MEKDVIESAILSTAYDKRYIIIDKATGEILDDAQGYGYKTRQNAYKAFAYKTRDKSKDKEKAAKKQLVKKWCKENRDFVSALEADAICIAKGSCGPDDKFDSKWVKKAFKEYGHLDLPFTASEFLKYWQ